MKLATLCVISIIALLIGCGTPSQRFASKAVDKGLFEQVIQSPAFKHRIYENRQVQQSTDSSVVHVYLDGDGTPWRHQQRLAEDPTSRNAMILTLIAQDNAPAILLGRPCYHGFSKSVRCTPKYWTSHRYGQEIVASLQQALALWLKQYTYRSVVLIGFSGGGTLAVLMAQKPDLVNQVVTLSANLDVTAWSQYHGYGELKHSLNPITEPALEQSIRQIHLAGQEDEAVPPEVVKAYVDKFGNAMYKSYPGFDHSCCWSEVWGDVLKMMK